MKRLSFTLTLIALIAAAVIMSSPSAIASSCNEDCRSYCCTESRCSDEKEAKCYSACVRDCENAATQPQKDKSKLPPT